MKTHKTVASGGRRAMWSRMDKRTVSVTYGRVAHLKIYNLMSNFSPANKKGAYFVHFVSSLLLSSYRTLIAMNTHGVDVVEGKSKLMINFELLVPNHIICMLIDQMLMWTSMVTTSPRKFSWKNLCTVSYGCKSCKCNPTSWRLKLLNQKWTVITLGSNNCAIFI